MRLKNIITIIVLSIAIFSCSKKDDEPAAVVVDNKLKLPAVFENSTTLIVPDAVGTGSACGSNTTPGTAQNTIVIDKEGIILDENKVTFEIDLADVYAGEVVVEIKNTSSNPAGNSISLIKRIGATAPSSCGTRGSFIKGNKLSFNAAFTQAIAATSSTGIPIVTGNYALSRGTDNFPSQVIDGNLANFLRSQDIKGTWTIKIYDCGTGDICTLYNWKIKFDVGALK